MLLIKKLVCKSCNKKFTFQNVTSIPKHCSYRCQRDYRNKRKREIAASKVFDIKLKCPECNNNFIKKSNSCRKYCSHECEDKKNRRVGHQKRTLRFKTDKKYKAKYDELKRLWREKNKDKLIQYRKKMESKESYQIKRKLYLKIYESKPENKKRRLAYSKEWRKRDYVKAKNKAYKLKNKDYIKKQSKEYSQRPEIRERTRNIIRKRLKNDPIFILKSRLRTRFYQYVKRGLAKKKVNTSKLIGCDWLYLKNHLEKQFKQGMNWKNFGKWHIDHIKPMAHFNLLNVNDQYKCCHYKNLQPLWANENLSKGARYIG